MVCMPPSKVPAKEAMGMLRMAGALLSHEEALPLFSVTSAPSRIVSPAKSVVQESILKPM